MFSVVIAGLALFGPAIAPLPAQPVEPDRGGPGTPPADPSNPLDGFGLPGDPLGGISGPAEITVSANYTLGTGDQPASLNVTATMAEGWHLYSLTQPEGGAMRTTIDLDRSSDYKKLGDFKPNRPPHVIAPETTTNPFPVPLEEHHETVTFFAPIRIARGVDPKGLTIAGELKGQVCREGSCIPFDMKFEATFAEGSAPPAGAPRFEATLAEGGAPPAGAPRIDFWAELFKKLEFRESEEGWSHGWFPGAYMGPTALKITAVALALILGFLAGLILNVMPCVLPVIGLKLMSFISQAGESRWRIFSLNVWYSLGMWAVFMVFAAVAAVLHLLGETFAWGEHLGDPRFSVPLLCLVYVLGLSMFGVWEIPIPGFMGSRAVNDLADKEGPAGAFSKGILTTVLATPCSGPFIGVAVGIAVIAPVWLNFAVFTSMAFGMAFPYLVVGAFPELIKLLPKPGSWMETLKQFMGFVLMGTAVWIVYFLEDRFVVPVLAMLVVLGVACWIVGLTSFTATFQQRLRSWGCAGIFVGAGILLLFLLLPAPGLPWEPYSPDVLQDYREQGHTVLVDFTADW